MKKLSTLLLAFISLAVISTSCNKDIDKDAPKDSSRIWLKNTEGGEAVYAKLTAHSNVAGNGNEDFAEVRLATGETVYLGHVIADDAALFDYTITISRNNQAIDTQRNPCTGAKGERKTATWGGANKFGCE